MKAFTDDHREVYRVEPICKVRPIAPSTDYAHAARQTDPTKASVRARHDALLHGQIQWLWDETFQVYHAQTREPAIAA